jgi:hypothetical protein
MKLAIRAATLAASLFVLPSSANAQDQYRVGREHWMMARYPEARPPLLGWRGARGGRTAEVDYMLGTSGCRIASARPWGARVLNFVLYSYPLSVGGRRLVDSELQRCRATAAIVALTYAQRNQIAMLAPGATAKGKLWQPAGGNPVPAHPARPLRPFWEGELAERIVPIGETARYQSMLARIAPQDAKIAVVGRFGFVTTSGHSDAQLARLEGVLENYTRFLQANYGLAPPPNYISIYLSPSIPALTKTADKVHNLEVSPATLGYAFPEDASVSAMVSGVQPGTLLHELFHLILRDSYGDMPQWLDEGVAALYEVSRQRNGVFEGVPNWRGKLLAVEPALRPSLREVITSPWFDFDGVSGGAASGAAEARQLALARYFALYLQTEGKLGSIFTAFRDRELGAAEDPAAEAVQIVERIAGPLPALERQFWDWYAGIGVRDDNYLPDVNSKELPTRT